MIVIRWRIFTIKVLFFIVSLHSFLRLEDDTHIKCSLIHVDNLGVERVLVLPSGKIDYYDRNLVEHYHNLNTSVD